MILHFFNGNMFHLVPHLIENILLNSEKTNAKGQEEHFFYISFFGSKKLFEFGTEEQYLGVFEKYNLKNYKFIYKKTDFIKYSITAGIRNKTFYHGSCDPFWLQFLLYSILLFGRFKKQMRNMHLICWGAIDFKTPGTGIRGKTANFLLGNIFKQINCTLTLTLGDFNLFKFYHPKAATKTISYLFEKEIKRQFPNKDFLNIMISHSGWPVNEHIKSMKLIKKFKNENIRIICPLCYGEPQYINEVIQYGEKTFGDKFSYFVELKPIDEYQKFTRSIDVFISSSNNQTGLFALKSCMLGGARLFLTGNLFSSMQIPGYIINNIKEIEKMPFELFSQPLSNEEYQQNIHIHTNKNFDQIIEGWRGVYV